jgi:DNA-binding NtrC family response regulator
MPANILIVDDASSHLRMIEYVIGQKLGYHVITASTSEEASQWALYGRHPQPDLMLLDMAMPNGASLRLIHDIRASRPQLPIIALVTYGDDSCAAQAVQAGVSDFLTKPVTLERLQLSLRNTLALKRMENAILRLERGNTGYACFADVIGHSATMKQAEAAASSKVPVWLEGESGTGKEWLARAIHGSSDRAGKPFVAVDCRELPDETGEAILFGRENPGDFILGKVREAEKGTLLLQGIGSLSPKLQSRVLEMLHEGCIRPQGSPGPVAVDVRIIAAVSQPVKVLAAAGNFNHTLHRRFQEIVISLVPLRERREDVPLLAKHFLVMYAALEGKSMIGLTEEARQHLANAPWPGNIHQLSRLMWQAVMLCNQEILDHGNLRLIEQWQPAYYRDNIDSLLSAASPLLFDKSGKIKKLKSIEEEIIRLALQHNNGCMTRVARQLGIGRSTLYRRISELEKEGYTLQANQVTPDMKASS